MAAVVITSCTNRKRHRPEARLRASRLGAGEVVDVASEWGRRLHSATGLHEVGALYCGRAFREAEAAAADTSGMMFVVSAGVGLVSANAKVPSYSLTIAERSSDNVLSLTLPAKMASGQTLRAIELEWSPAAYPGAAALWPWPSNRGRCIWVHPYDVASGLAGGATQSYPSSSQTSEISRRHDLPSLTGITSRRRHLV